MRITYRLQRYAVQYKTVTNGPISLVRSVQEHSAQRGNMQTARNKPIRTAQVHPSESKLNQDSGSGQTVASKLWKI